MKNHHIVFIFFISVLLISCNKTSEKKETPNNLENLSPNINVEKLLSTYLNWWTYHSNTIALNSDFVGFDEQSNKISKLQFLKELNTGSYIALKLTKEENNLKLYKLNSLVNKDISNTIKYESLTSLKHFKLEGKSFPEFNLIDLSDVNYTNKNTKGKITVFKTWFINCQACVAEFEELNDFVAKNKDEIIFISLAQDSKEKLKSFLQKRSFKYAVVPNQKEFIEEELKFTIFPTHIVVNEEGVILKVVNNATQMISFLENKIRLDKSLVAPPSPI